ncbi:unnamed protein product [Leptidea sinapis]|uniref:PHD-type domain-containing protein n=1 Tax=Leptidea sinapis TaxID=189913 RepID=A0A5E4QWH4_9NEOP|nr:unnamed protein product [Leptidea sinapis]
MGLQCEACSNSINVTQKRIKCTSCALLYHSECVNFDDTSLLSRNQWKCPSCLIKQRKVGYNSKTPVRSSKPQGSITQPSINVCNPSEISDLLPHLEELLDKKLKTIKEEIVAVIKNSLLKQIKDEVKAMSSQFNLIQESYQVLQNEHHDLKQDIVKLQADIVEKDDQISELRHSINKQQQWCRQSNIEIVGLPEAPNENPKTLMVEIAKHAGLELSFDEIEFAHRVQPFKSTPKRPKPHVIKLKDRITKDRILSGLRKTKGATLDGLFKDGLVEIMWPFSAFGLDFDEAIRQKKLKCIKLNDRSEVILDRNHEYVTKSKAQS